MICKILNPIICFFVDQYSARGDWGPPALPLVVGHEIGGVVVAVGSNVTEFSVGDHGGVGCMVDSCRSCRYYLIHISPAVWRREVTTSSAVLCLTYPQFLYEFDTPATIWFYSFFIIVLFLLVIYLISFRNCSHGEEQYCSTGSVYTYNSKYKYCVETGGQTYGGYSKHIVVDKAFALKIPKTLDLASATPLLCAGITLFSPMIKFGVQATTKFAVAGLGGLGHMGVKFGVAFGCNTTVISRGQFKKATAMAMGANDFIDSTNPAEMAV